MFTNLCYSVEGPWLSLSGTDGLKHCATSHLESDPTSLHSYSNCASHLWRVYKAGKTVPLRSNWIQKWILLWDQKLERARIIHPPACVAGFNLYSSFLCTWNSSLVLTLNCCIESKNSLVLFCDATQLPKPEKEGYICKVYGEKLYVLSLHWP